jgi:hypothetical protein
MSEDTTKKINPRDVFNKMAENSAIKTLRTPGKVTTQVLPQSRKGSLPFRKGVTVYGTLAAIRQGSDHLHLQNSKERLHASFTIQELHAIVEDGQPGQTSLWFGKKIRISIEKGDLRKLLTDTGAIKNK